MAGKGTDKEITEQQTDSLYVRIKKDAEGGGYHLNPDEQFSKALVEGLLVNESRYGYQSCPCRLSSGYIEKDRDIICPCDYRDADINDYGACYCGLYVNQDIFNGLKKLTSIPERRLTQGADAKEDNIGAVIETVPELHQKPRDVCVTLKMPVWRCRVCGYLCARENPPEICPICKAKKDRFEKFI